MKGEIAKLLPNALQATETFLMKDGKVIKEYTSYTASMGAVIRTSGLIPTLAFYTDAHRSGDTERYKLLKAIAHCIPEIGSVAVEEDKDQRLLLLWVLKKVYQQDIAQRKIVEKINEKGHKQQELIRIPDIPPEGAVALKTWTKRIVNISIALKLAMRNYPQTD